MHAADDDAEVAGLLALMLLTDARRPARTDASGTPVTLADQDRSRWDRARIAEGTALLDGAIGRGAVGEYQLQAAIAAIHDRAPSADATDWPQILALYELLERMTGSPVVTLNRAVAAAMVHGPAAGLAVLDAVDEHAPPRRPARERTCTSRPATTTFPSPTTAARRAGRRTSRNAGTSTRRWPGSPGSP